MGVFLSGNILRRVLRGDDQGDDGRMSEYIITCNEETALWVANDVDSMKPIIRCRDCKWFTPEYWYEEERDFATREILCEPPNCGNPERCSVTYDSITKQMVPVHIVTEPDGFCAWGERIER